MRLDALNGSAATNWGRESPCAPLTGHETDPTALARGLLFVEAEREDDSRLP